MKLIISGFILAAVIVGLMPVAPVTIKGIVSDENGHALSFVSVTEKGAANSTVTDTLGQFTITVTKPGAILVFSFVGYDTKEVKSGSKTSLTVQLAASGAKPEEVVVEAFGVANAKKEITYSQIEYKAADLTAADGYVNAEPIPHKSLQARLPGLSITSKPYDKEDGEEQAYNTEDYDAIKENVFLSATDNPLSTFSIDVDAASYSNVRRYLNNGQLPPAGAVRVEEMINYFKYDYAAAGGKHPFAVNTELGTAPWNPQHTLALVHLKAKTIDTKNLPVSNLVFLIDVSGSMEDDNKLPLVKQSMKLLTDQLRENDKVAIVVYAGNAGVVLPATAGHNKQTIKDAIDRLEAGGSTAGGEGIKLAYKIARENLVKSGNNRVILCTDGDFNVGLSSDSEMEKLIEAERKSGIYLTVLGYGMGNYKDNKMQKLADKGNGNHAYIDNLNEAKKVLVSEFGGTLFTVAKDVKLQVEFNPAQVQAYRLIGYENRMLNKEDFNDDTKDAGELGSGHTVTALYEIIPVGVKSEFVKTVDPLRYQKKNKEKNNHYQGELMTIKCRYKNPDSDVSQLAEQTIMENSHAIPATSDNFRFAAAVAEFGMLLSNSSFKQEASYENVLRLALSSKGEDSEGYRKEFLELVQKAGSIAQINKNNQQEAELVKQR